MPEPIATHRLLSADFLTLSYRVVGKVMTPNTGVVGLMNDTTTSLNGSRGRQISAHPRRQVNLLALITDNKQVRSIA